MDLRCHSCNAVIGHVGAVLIAALDVPLPIRSSMQEVLALNGIDDLCCRTQLSSQLNIGPKWDRGDNRPPTMQ